MPRKTSSSYYLMRIIHCINGSSVVEKNTEICAGEMSLQRIKVVLILIEMK